MIPHPWTRPAHQFEPVWPLCESTASPSLPTPFCLALPLPCLALLYFGLQRAGYGCISLCLFFPPPLSVSLSLSPFLYFGLALPARPVLDMGAAN